MRAIASLHDSFIQRKSIVNAKKARIKVGITKKHIYWGIGITTSFFTIAGLIYHHRKKIKKAAEKDQRWIQTVVAKISSPFGHPTNPITKQQQFHNRIDLPVPADTNIKNPMDGTEENVFLRIREGIRLLSNTITGIKPTIHIYLKP